MQWLVDTIVGIYNSLILTLKGWFQAVVDGFKWAVTSIIDFFTSMVNWLLDLAWGFCYYLYDLFLGEYGLLWTFFDFLLDISNSLVSALPEFGYFLGGYEGIFVPVISLLCSLNSIFPISETLFLLVVYLGVALSVILYRMVLKATPLTGN